MITFLTMILSSLCVAASASLSSNAWDRVSPEDAVTGNDLSTAWRVPGALSCQTIRLPA